ncbi:hypothetical protein E3U23_11150 [Erythrobacter litoralis]|uniref:hypothetical protein n=1 Tax=Erythrobacter litoralis TaxID=39960 RepID=UPI0024358632|nr:hypothetical protein [Erythrobacter litoralis]MDG6079745.1 hypothetical protein [Erythrobacter litoralis]
MQRNNLVPLHGVRSTSFGPPEGLIVFEGWDYREAEFRFEVRDRRDGGRLRAELGKVTSAYVQGVYVAGFETVDGVPITTVWVRINDFTMHQMPMPTPGEDTELVWGLHVTPPGEFTFEAIAGPFHVRASAVASPWA